MNTQSQAEADQQYVQAVRALFGMHGWHEIVKDITSMRAAISQKFPTISQEDLRYEQGRYEGLGQIIGMEQWVDQVEQGIASPGVTIKLDEHEDGFY